MNHRELVQAAISHRQTPRIPKGELTIDGGFISKALPNRTGDPFEDRRALMELLGLDMVVIDPDPLCPGEDGSRDTFGFLKRWVQETDYFVCVMVGGPFYRTMIKSGMEAFLEGILRRPAGIEREARDMIAKYVDLGLEYIEAGASGVMIGDDIAHSKATYISPDKLQEHFFPLLQEEIRTFKESGAAVLFHSDGNYRQVLDEIVAMGVDGVHCLQGSCGMNSLDLKEAYRGRITLMGNLEAGREMEGLSRGEIKGMVKGLLADWSGGGGYIFGTCSGLSQHTEVEHVLASYEAVREYETR